MLKKDTEGGLLRLMHLVKRTGVEKSTEKADQAETENAQALKTDEVLRAANPDDDAGEKVIENPQAAPAEDEAIMHEASLEGLKGLSARTANELFLSPTCMIILHFLCSVLFDNDIPCPCPGCILC